MAQVSDDTQQYAVELGRGQFADDTQYSLLEPKRVQTFRNEFMWKPRPRATCCTKNAIRKSPPFLVLPQQYQQKKRNFVQISRFNHSVYPGHFIMFFSTLCRNEDISSFQPNIYFLLSTEHLFSDPDLE